MYKIILFLLFVGAVSTSEIPSQFVIGGRDASPGQFPYMVSLRFGDDRMHGCGGGILNQRWVLSAAHCFVNFQPNQIMVGSVRVNATGDRYGVIRSIMHPLFPPTLEHMHNYSNWHDVGLVHIDRPIRFNQFVQPIPLVRRRFFGTGLATIAGFGAYILDRVRQDMRSPEHLQFTRLKIITNTECAIRARLFGPLEPLFATPTIYSGHICTMARRGVGVCFGDSGSMLITRDGIVGIVASGVLPCARGAPDVFIRVSTYLSWIDSYVNNLT